MVQFERVVAKESLKSGGGDVVGGDVVGGDGVSVGVGIGIEVGVKAGLGVGLGVGVEGESEIEPWVELATELGLGIAVGEASELCDLGGGDSVETLEALRTLPGSFDFKAGRGQTKCQSTHISTSAPIKTLAITRNTARQLISIYVSCAIC